MIHRLLTKPENSFFLFGARGTGKTTWLRQNFPVKDTLFIDLLKSSEYLPYKMNPGLLRDQIQSGEYKFVVLDEIQKLPELLDEIHSLIFDYKNKIQFVLTGSSARKIKRLGGNMLAGRAVWKEMHPLSLAEIKETVPIDLLLQFGSLPQVINLKKPQDKKEYLYSYAETYLKTEIQEEAIVRKLDAFIRFIRVAANLNGFTLNISNVSRETGISRSSVEGYYSILVDTLIGFIVPAWTPKFKIKENLHPKFYFFDPGVVRILSNKIEDKVEQSDRGYLFETLVLNELRSSISTAKRKGEIYYWSIPSGGEVDFIIEAGSKKIAIEVKSTATWSQKYSNHLNEMLDSRVVTHAFGIYCGNANLKQGKIKILKLESVASELAKILRN